MKKILLISDYDSRLSWGVGLLKFFSSENYDFFALLIRSEVPSNLDLCGIPFVSITTSNTITNKEVYVDLENYDVIILAIGGAAHVKFFYLSNHYCSEKDKPIFISGFNGLIDDTNPHGLLCRLGSDYICINSPKNLEKFTQTLSSLGVNSSSLYLTGIIRDYLGKIPFHNSYKNSVICYVDQSLIFKSNKERYYVAEKLIEIALKNPLKKVIVLIREKKNTSNPGGDKKDISYFISKILKNNGRYIENLLYYEGKPYQALQVADHIISFSSTLILEALAKGKYASVIIDLGISHQYGNHVFIGSSLLSCFDDIINGKVKVVDKEWFDKNVFYSDIAVANFTEDIDKEVHAFLEDTRQEKLFYSQERFGFFYSFLTNNQTKEKGIANEFLQKIKKTIFKATSFFR